MSQKVVVAEYQAWSVCPDCGNCYTDKDIEDEIVTPCSKCYKCYVGDCGVVCCECYDEEETDEEDFGFGDK